MLKSKKRARAAQLYRDTNTTWVSPDCERLCVELARIRVSVEHKNDNIPGPREVDTRGLPMATRLKFAERLLAAMQLLSASLQCDAITLAIVTRKCLARQWVPPDPAPVAVLRPPIVFYAEQVMLIQYTTTIARRLETVRSLMTKFSDTLRAELDQLQKARDTTSAEKPKRD